MTIRQDTPAPPEAAPGSSPVPVARAPHAPHAVARSGDRHTHVRRRRARVRAAVAICAGRASAALLRRLRLGGGTSLPGLIARAIAPGLTPELASQLGNGSVVITGTNGKTSTSGLTAYALRAAGLRVWRNREGSNLARGVTASLIQHASLGESSSTATPPPLSSRWMRPRSPE